MTEMLMAPAASREGGQRPSVVIDRPVLQDVLLERVGHAVTTGKEVTGYEVREDGVTGFLSDMFAAGGHDAPLKHALEWVLLFNGASVICLILAGFKYRGDVARALED